MDLGTRALRKQRTHIDGFQDMNLVESHCGVVGLAQCDTPSKGFKFVGSQRKDAEIQRAGLWAAENRSRAERNHSKIVRKLEKCLISYKVFKVVVRVRSKLVPLASADADMEPHWQDVDLPSADVKQPLEELVSNIEWGHGKSKPDVSAKIYRKKLHFGISACGE